MERGAGKQSYKAILDSTVTVFIFCIVKSVNQSWSEKMGDVKRVRAKWKRDRGVGEMGFVKTKKESGYCKE